MAELKYEKNVVRNPRDKNPGHKEIVHPVAWLRGGQNWGINFHMNWECISQPFLMESAAMVHEFDQILCFMGGNITDLWDFGAEIELTLGEGKDAEKYLINSPTTAYIPKGLPHGPLFFKKIDKPIMFNNIVFVPQYIRRRK
jgi:hypothetical protein